MKDIIRSENLSFIYPENQRGLNSISLSIQPGEAVFIRGSSGCGKSTLARCLCGIIPHLYNGSYSGEVWLDGLNVEKEPLWKLSEKSGLVFQNPNLQILAPFVEEEIIFGLENLGLDRGNVSARLEAELKRFDLEKYRSKNPNSLSGGEQQKLSLAAIAARHPKTLVLDEPLSMLDTNAAGEFLDYLNQLLQDGVTVVICEHRQEYLARIPNLKTFDLGELQENSPAQTIDDLSLDSTEVLNTEEIFFKLKVSNLQSTIGGRKLFCRTSFDIENGQVVALVGRNGSGKTTLLRSFSGFQYFEGDIKVQANGETLNPEFGMVFQNPDMQLFNATVRDEILYRHVSPDLAWYEWLLSVLNLKTYEHKPPLLLSEGEKRRVALATVLMHKPRHGILLDEPALGQDNYHKEILIRLLRALAQKGYLVIYSTHDMEFAAKADKMLLLSPQSEVRLVNSDGFLSNGKENWDYLDLTRPEWLA